MAKIDKVQEVSITKLTEYPNNAKIHTQEQIRKIAESIKEFGFLSPCLIDKEYNIIAGHGRLLAAKSLNMKTIPCVFIEGLTDAQKKAYTIADNRLGELATWDMTLVEQELAELADADFNIDLTGFEYDPGTDWFEERDRDDTSRQEGNDEYNEFLDKFEQAKTTDDCYTPDVVYDAVASYVREKYGDAKFVRPFYPGGDYQNYTYPKGCIVVDNPPFSILAEIRRWYCERGIKYFLFAPAVSCMMDVDCAMAVGVNVIYENGANVSTAFVTNLEEGTLAMSSPDLYKRVQDAADEYAKSLRKSLPKYEYPACVVTAAALAKLSKYGEEFRVKKGILINELDEQKAVGKGIYGRAYLISERAAAERAAAERAAAERAAAERAAATTWSLSERELEMQRSIGD